jgi:ABC-type phosphate/phosphonate transport system ATPase subunit
MLISKFVVPADEMTDVGLQAINMDKRGKFVALTGKNGAGKSQILAKLNTYIVKIRQLATQIDGNCWNINCPVPAISKWIYW